MGRPHGVWLGGEAYIAYSKQSLNSRLHSVRIRGRDEKFSQ